MGYPSSYSRRNEGVAKNEDTHRGTGIKNERVGTAAENRGHLKLSEPSHGLLGVQVSTNTRYLKSRPIHIYPERRVEYVDGEHGPGTSLEPHRGRITISGRVLST